MACTRTRTASAIRSNLERYGISPTVTFLASDTTKITLGYEYLHDGRTADRGITSFQGRPADVDIATFYGNPNDSHVRADVNLASATVEHRSGAVTIRNHTLLRRLRSRLSELRSRRRDRRQDPGRPHRVQQRHGPLERLQSDGPHLCGLDRHHPPHAACGRRVRPPAHRQLPEHGVLQQHGDFDSGAVRATRQSQRLSPSGKARRTPTITCGPISRRRTRRIRSSSRATSTWSPDCDSIASTWSITTTGTATRWTASTISCRHARAWCASQSLRCRVYGSYTCPICRAQAISSRR